MRKIGFSVLVSLFALSSVIAQDDDKKVKHKKDVGAHIYDHDTTIVDDEKNIYEVENLGDKINSRHIESGPRISPDGKSLYFFRVNHPKNYSHTRDIWVSHYSDADSTWGEAEHLKYPLNNYGDNSVHSISPDGNTLLLHNVYLKNGLTKNGVSISTFNESREKWNYPKEIKFKGYHNDQTCSFFLCNDNKTMILAIHEKDSYGEQDLYVSFQDEKGKWTKPMNMGPILNTAKSEATAFMFSDGETLYYSSNGNPGKGSLGGYDIYKTTRLDSTWTKWSIPENLGSPYNTKDDEFYFSIPAKGDYSYLSHHFFGQDSLEHSDIVRIKMIERPMLYAHIEVYDYITKERIEAKLFLEKVKSVEGEGFTKEQIFKGVVTDTNTLDVNLNGGDVFRWRFKKEGYQSMDSIMDLAYVKKREEDTVKFYLKPDPKLAAHIEVYDYYTKERIEAKVKVEKVVTTKSGMSTAKVFMGVVTDTSTVDLELDGGEVYNWSFKKKGYQQLDSVTDLSYVTGLEEDTIKFFLKEDPKMNVTVIAIDEETGDTITTSLSSFVVQPSKKVYKEGFPDSTTKSYNTSLKAGVVYDLKVSDGDFYVAQTIEDIDLTQLRKVKDTVITVTLKPILESIEFDLPDIYFIFAKTDLDPRSNESLDKLVEALNTYKVILKAEIGGHTDSRGSEKNNQKLSEGRSQAIVEYLVDKGIDRERLVSKGYGESEILNGCTDGVQCTEDEHLANRRVVLKLLEVKKSERKKRN